MSEQTKDPLKDLKQFYKNLQETFMIDMLNLYEKQGNKVSFVDIEEKRGTLSL